MNRFLFVTLSLCLVAGCSSKDAAPTPDASVDAAPDASVDAAPDTSLPDGSADGAVTDAAPADGAVADGSADGAVTDAAPDAAPDALPDAAADSSVPLPDASFDGGGESVCTANCARVLACIDGPTMAECLVGCSMAIPRCSTAELTEFERCLDETTCENYLRCTEGVLCLEA